MCKAIDDKSKEYINIPSYSTAQYAGLSTSFISNNIIRLCKPPYTIKKIFLLLFLLSVIGIISLYTFHSGFRRTIQFWKGMTPFILKYKWLKIKAEKIDHCTSDELEARLNVLRTEQAPKLVDLIIRMGGIYVKIGQVMSTVGQGLLPQQYVDALQPLQDGMPPRDYKQVSQIIEKSTGKTMGELFVDFDIMPIGAASIAQVHKATLRPQTEGGSPIPVVVKIQYPEVAEMFEADLSNLELATRLFAPDNIDIAKAMRKRHENELDFRLEARNMKDCTRDMQQHGVEPSLVRIPRVIEELCTRDVLAMEYLDGISLSDAIQQEQHSLAKALGKKDGDDLKKVLASRMRKHFENGGGAGSGGLEMLGSKKMKLVNVLGPSAATVLRTYASLRDAIENMVIGAVKIGSQIQNRGIGTNLAQMPLISQDDSSLIADSAKKKKKKINLGRALKTLVHVSGIQLMISGVYNADVSSILFVSL